MEKGGFAMTQSPLMLKMQTLRKSLSQTEQKVIDFILAHPREVIYLSITGLAEKSGVSDATIVRVCKRIGMQGYQDLKVNLAQDIVSPLESIHEELKDGDGPEQILEKVFNSAIHTLEYTRRIASADSLEKAAGLLASADAVFIFGLGNSHAVAVDLMHKLMRLGIHATAYTDSHMQAIAATHTGPRDVIVAISHSGSSRDVVDAAELAKKQGARVISISNIGRSPLSDLADINLETASQETQYRIVALASRIAQYTIIDTLYTLIAMQQREQANTRFRAIEKALENKKY
jgi:DNA-binding MurR/RpiR family transcriptional regulator